jgi:RNA-binding motif X-linked protein 2
MSQWGEIEDLNLVRDKETGKSMGFCFVKYEDQRSTILAVDNFNGIKLLGMTLRCDHVDRYKLPKHIREREEAAIEEDPSRDVQLGPGHAYMGKELANEFSIDKGINMWARPTKPVSNETDVPSSVHISAAASAEGAEDGRLSHKKDRKEKKKHKHKKDDREKRRSRSRSESRVDRRYRYERRSRSSSSSRSSREGGGRGVRGRGDEDRRHSSRGRHIDDRERREKRSRSKDRDRHEGGKQSRWRVSMDGAEALTSIDAIPSSSGAPRAPAMAGVSLPPASIAGLPGRGSSDSAVFDVEAAPVASWRGRLDPSLASGPVTNTRLSKSSDSYYRGSASSFAGIKRPNPPSLPSAGAGVGGGEPPAKRNMFDTSFGGMARRR